MDGSAAGKLLAGLIKPLGGFWNQLSGARRRLLIVLVATLVVIAGLLAWFLNRTQYAVLYTDLSAAEAGAILQQLSDRKVEAMPQGSDTILVPRDQVDKLRMDLAAGGYPRSGSSLDILQQGVGFGMTEEDKAVYRRYQLQQDLQNAIKTFDSVADARVSLIIPEKSSFLIESQNTPATAAVLLTLRPGAALSSANVRAIAELVAKSVPDLKPDSITIIDSQMNVLNTETGSAEILAKDQLQMEQQVRDRLKKQVLALLQPVFGIDKVLAEVSVRLDFDSGTIESVRFEPVAGSSSGIISSIDKIREVANQAAKAGGDAGTGSNGSGAPIYPVAQANDTVYEKNSEKIAYEISTIRESLTKAKGAISDLSVSVVLDEGTAVSGSYADSVRSLVASAVGVSAEHITVAALPFNGKSALDKTFSDLAATSDKALQWERTRFYIVLGASLLLALLLLVGILIVLRGPRAPAFEDDDRYPAGVGAGLPGGARSMAAGSKAGGAHALSMSRQAALARIAGSSTVRSAASPMALAGATPGTLPETEREDDLPGSEEKATAEQYVRENPELAANIIRGWLTEEQG